MKKVITLFSTFIFALFLTACSQEEETEPKIYKNGTYIAQVENPNYGYEEAVVTIKNDKIESILLRRLEDDGTETNYDHYTGEEVDADVPFYGGKTLPDLKYYRFKYAETMVEEQSNDVDDISGATASSIGWKAAVEKALEEAKINSDSDAA